MQRYPKQRSTSLAPTGWDSNVHSLSSISVAGTDGNLGPDKDMWWLVFVTPAKLVALSAEYNSQSVTTHFGAHLGTIGSEAVPLSQTHAATPPESSCVEPSIKLLDQVHTAVHCSSVATRLPKLQLAAPFHVSTYCC